MLYSHIFYICNNILLILFKNLFFLAALCGLRDLGSLTKDGTQARGSESAESYLLDHQKIPLKSILNSSTELSHLLQHKELVSCFISVLSGPFFIKS